MAEARTEIHPLSDPVRSLWGVGPDREAQLGRLGIHTVRDLLLHAPRRYEDRRHSSRIADLKIQEPATVRGVIVAAGVKTWHRGLRSVFEMILDDGSARLHCRWWNQPYMQNYFEQGEEWFVHGKMNSVKPRVMDHPDIERIEPGEENFIHLNRIVPIYPLTEGLGQRWLRQLIWRLLEEAAAGWKDPFPIPASLHLPEGREAIRHLHFPSELEETEVARRRLALDELIALQLSVLARRRRMEEKSKGLPCSGTNQLIRPFLKQISFRLTGAQTRVLREIRADLGGPHPMRRLLQGDVGSGKTVVAACSALMALECGFNVLLMAPTQILAEQHFQTFERWFRPLGIDVGLHTSTARKPGASNAPRLVVGTHALIEEGVEFLKLGLVIIDEQHKFGVAQRERLVRKGNYPHLLVMTATPIPRTLGLTLYADLDVSVIDELPAGRKTIVTRLHGTRELTEVWKFVKAQLAAGRQAYVVYSRIEESERVSVKGVAQEFERLKKIFHPHAVGLLHGRIDSAEKEAVMERFRSGALGVLMATSVIEVGVDVPNATVMVVENADQFGLAQLHQLRGRIGRGAHESFCLLVADPKTQEARQRLSILEKTQDGFEIAQADLRLRGPGELLGKDQSGVPDFRFARLIEDEPLVLEARRIASELLKSGRFLPGEIPSL